MKIIIENKTFEIEKNTIIGKIIEQIELKDKKYIIAVKIGEEIKDLHTNLDHDAELLPVYLNSPDGLEVVRHSTAHIMASAVAELYGDVKLGIGPTIENGFYYDFDVKQTFSETDLPKIEAKMQEMIKGNFKFEREEISKEEALKKFEGDRYKKELIEELDGKILSTYKHNGFTDLCRGPHVPSTGYVKAFKLLSVAGAYWRGSEKNPMMQRIYGAAFNDKNDLQTYLKLLQEAKDRDHRKLGKDLDLFSINETIGPGLVCWHPKGGMIRHLIESFWKDEHIHNEYDIVYTPHIAKINLWETSGHTGFYRENMYSPMDVENQKYLAKPMNCPFHVTMYKNKLWSYREFPIRWAELGTVYRYEKSGVLHGLLRVRGFTQDDAHIFIREDQMSEEIERTLRFCIHMLSAFGFDRYDIYLSTRPEKFVGTPDNWDKATRALQHALEKCNLTYHIDPGEGVFYGPKIDIKIKDALNRSWQCSTIQADFNLPERFDINYVGSDGSSHRPIMIHRALLGSIERFMGCLIEHYKGAFPLWLAPTQVRVLSITDRSAEFAHEIFTTCKKFGIRIEEDFRNEKLGFKIREAQLQKIPYVVIIGDNETNTKTLSVRNRAGNEERDVKLDIFLEKILKEVKEKQSKQ